MDDLFRTILSSPEFAAFLIASAVALASWIGKSVKALLVNSLDEKQLAMVFSICENAVRVAEQTGLAKTNEEKKAEAIRVAQTYLDAYGIKISADRLSSAIEAAVYSEFTQFKTPTPPVEVTTTEAATGPAV
jgi:hypothetical protein